jgi:xylulokinase
VNAKPVHLGIDLGTSSVKGVLVADDGTVVASAERALALEESEPGAAEQDAGVWWVAARETIAELVATPSTWVTAVGLTGQKHAFLPLDAAGKPLCKAVLWCDGRATTEATQAEEAIGRSALGKRTGQIALPGLFVPKWLRFRERSPELAKSVARFAFTKDFLREKLTGTWATDRTEASSSLLYDVGRKAWSEELCAAFHVDATRLPPVGRSGDLAGKVTAHAAADTGLREGTPVVYGSGDNEAAGLGAGATGEGRVAVVLGTSGTVIAHHQDRGAAGGLVWGRHAMRRGYAVTGVVLSAGRALEWIRRTAFARDVTTEEVLAAAESADPGEGSLVFLPSLAGERSPVPDAGATGAFVGLRPGHTRGHLARAVLEGVALSIAEIVMLMRGAGVPVTELRLTSGGARSPFWRGLVGAACGLPVVPVGEQSGPAVGAAMLAARGTGRFSSLAQAAAEWVRPPPPEPPAPREVGRLSELRAHSSAVRNALRGVGSPTPRRARKPARASEPGAT